MTVGAHCDGVGLRHGAALFERCATGATSEFVQRHGPSSLCGYLGLDKARSVRIEPRSSVDRKTGQPGGAVTSAQPDFAMSKTPGDYRWKR